MRDRHSGRVATCLAELRRCHSLNTQDSCSFKIRAMRRAKIRPRDMRRRSLRITVSIKDNSLLRVIIKLFFFSTEPRVENFQEFKKSLKLFPLSFIFNSDFTVEMAPKAKHVASSSSAVAPEVQMGGPSTQEAPISGNKTI